MTRPFRSLSGFILVAAICAGACWYLYAPALRAPFVFDDIDNIVNNTRIRLTVITPGGLAGVMTNQFGNRPLAYASFALNYYAGRYNVGGYRLVNLAIHVIAALLVFLIARMTFDRIGERGLWPPLLAAVLWLVNPVHTQSVTYIVQRMNILSALFVLLALACYIGARRMQAAGRTGFRPLLLMAAAGIAGLCGLASKETAAILPVVLLLYEWFFFQDLNRAWLKKQLAWIGAAALALAVIALIYTGGNPVAMLTGMYDRLGFTPAQRLLTEPQVVLYYLTLLLFPHPDRLNLDYSFPLAVSPFSPATTLPAILGLTALTVAAVYAAGKHRLFSFAIIWFLAALAIESSFIGLALIFEHRTYLPSVFPAMAAVHLLTRRIRPRLAGVLAVCALIAVWGYGTCQRNRVWAAPLRFWEDCNAKTPASPNILNNLGVALREAGRTEAARQAFQQALSHDPGWLSALSNLGSMLLDQGRHTEALELFEKTIKIEPDYYDGHYNRGLALLGLGRVIAAARSFEETLRLNPFHEKAHNNLGVTMMRQLDPDQAIVHFQRALELDPGFVKARSNMGIAYFKKGMTDRAVDCFNQALDMDPFHVEAYDNMRRVRSQAQKYEPEINRLEQDLRQRPEDPLLHFRLAETCEKAGMTYPALEHYRKALSLQPDAVDCLNNLANLYAAHYQYSRAADLFERLSVLVPETAAVHYNLACLYALMNQPEKALSRLETAINKGYDNWDQIAADSDLDTIRETDRFREMVNARVGITGE